MNDDLVMVRHDKFDNIVKLVSGSMDDDLVMVRHVSQIVPIVVGWIAGQLERRRSNER